MRRKWTIDDDTYLRNNFSTVPYEDIAKHLNSTVASIACRVRRLKLDRKLLFTEYEDNFLIENHSKIPNKEIAKTLNISLTSIERRINQLKLSVDKKYTEYEDSFIRANYLLMTYSKIGKMIGRTQRAIDCRCSVLGLKKVSRKTYTQDEINRIISANSINARLELAKEFGVAYNSVCGLLRRRANINCKLCNKFRSMVNRCYNKNNHDYKNYGMKGISICDEWLSDDKKFIEWAINSGYEEHLTIDRIDSTGPYSPDNCRWATIEQQANNKSTNVFLTAFNETKTLSEWSNDVRCLIKYSALKDRVRSGSLEKISPEEILTLSRQQIVQRKKEQNVNLQS